MKTSNESTSVDAGCCLYGEGEPHFDVTSQSSGRRQQPGKDTFHRVPRLPGIINDAVECIPASLVAVALLGASAGAPVAAPISLESAPPVVVSTIPSAGATDVDPALTEIRVTYSKPMQDGSWSWSTWGEENFPEIVGDIRYMDDQRTCILPVKLEPGRFYATWLNSEKFRNFKDLEGRPAVPYLLTFATRADSPSKEVALREVALQFAAAIQERNNDQLQALSTDAVVKGWTDAVTHFGDEIRVRLNESGAGLDPLSQIEKVLVQGNLAAVKTAHLKDKGIYLALFFCRTPEGWRNCCLQNSPASKSLEQNLKEFEDRENAMAKLSGAAAAKAGAGGDLLNDDQKAVIAWTDRQFRSYFDERNFDGWSAEEVQAMEAKCIDALSGPRSREYYTAINTLGAMRSTNALPRLRGFAFERVDGNNRNRWMATRVLGIMGDQQSIPDLIHLVYHGNQNTHWWAQIALVQLTGQNFGGDWEAWGKWWNESGGRPPYNPEIIRWWDGQADTVEGLKQTLAESNEKFIKDITSR